MILCEPDWSPTLFEEVGINEETVAGLGALLGQYLDYFSPCFSRSAQQRNAEIYIKGLLSNLDRKSVEPIALRYADENTVRTLQQFQKSAPWNEEKMKELYQERVLANFAVPEGMVTIDGSDFVKKGKHSAGVTRQYCGRMGKVENCQAGVFIGYSGANGYGLLDARLYLPESWFGESHKSLWEGCDIPENTVFKTKPQLAMDMIEQISARHGLPFGWVGCDSAFGCDADFRAMLPESVYFFADIRSNQHVFLTRPEWAVPARKSNRGKAPTLPVPSIKPMRVSDIAADESMPWTETVIAIGSKGPITAKIKRCRVIEYIDGKDGDECWLYIRKHENDEIRYALSNAPADIENDSLDHAAVLRWPIEQSFQECKSELGMKDYETRSYVGWHRHMLLVMLAHLFVLETRFSFVKKTNAENQDLF
jgi:SRSO17 transposase